MAQARKRGIKSSAQDNFLEPHAPTIGTLSNVPSGRGYDDGRADIEFTAAATGPAATSFKVFNASNDTEIASGSSSPISITGLASNSSLTVYVKASNAVGDSPKSSNSGSVTITTVPATPSAPSASSPSAGVDSVSWSAPNNGGSSITGYTWESDDGKSGTTASTSVNVDQEQGTAQSYRVKATNANGDSAWSSYSSSVTTTFSFAPFGFTPFGFTPFGAFGFTPFGFTPFGAFGFTPFGAFGFLNFGFSPSQCVHEDTLIKTPSGLVAAKDIKIGDSVYTLDINEINSEDPLSLNSSSLTSSGLIESEVQNIEPSQKDIVVWFNGDDSAKFSQEQPMFVKRDGQYGIISSGLIDVNDILIKVSDSGEITETVVNDVQTQEGTFNVYSFATGPKSWYIAGDYLVHIK